MYHSLVARKTRSMFEKLNDADAGPFTYVPGSHRLTPERLAWEQRMSLSARQSPVADTRQGSFRVSPAELRALAHASGLDNVRVRTRFPARMALVAEKAPDYD